MNRTRIITLSVAVVAVLAAGVLVADEPKPVEKSKKPTKDEVKTLMIAVHRGEKSPLARTQAELKKEMPAWEQLGKDAKEFAKMAEVLKVGASPYTDPAKYIASAAALEKATTAKDSKKIAAAVLGLRQSCAACHYGVPK